MIDFDKLIQKTPNALFSRKLLPTNQAELRKIDKFIKGPLPLDWIAKNAQLPGKALNVGLALWYLSGLNKSNTIKLTQTTLREFGVSPRTSYRLLARMERAGLIHVLRHCGRSPIVTIKRQ